MKCLFLFLSFILLAVNASSAEIQEGEMAGYLFGPAEKVPEEFNGGFSLYAAAWPLVGTYPGHKFQTGLCGTWMHPQYEPGKGSEGKCYTDIEGGLICEAIPVVSHHAAITQPYCERTCGGARLFPAASGIVGRGSRLLRLFLSAFEAIKKPDMEGLNRDHPDNLDRYLGRGRYSRVTPLATAARS